MKTKALIFLILLTTNLIAQTPVCFTTPDGTDGSGWSYKDYIIPTGYKLDSVNMDATRSGYSASDFDFVLESCADTTVYNNSGVYPFDYNTDNNSEYGIWINLTSFNYTSIGMVRVSLPTNAGAVWNQICFAISPIISNCGILIDVRDGQTYQTVSIGTQCWMKQNLNYGTQVSDVTVMTNNSVVEKACYNNTTSNCDTFGGIYTWDEAMNYSTNEQGICPTGWHIPTQTEWQILINFLGSTTAGYQMKAAATDSIIWDGNNSSGFTGIPGGIGQGTNYLYMGQRNTYWSSSEFSSTDAYDYGLTSGINTLDEANNTKNSGYCIRCIMDNITTGFNSTDHNTISIYPNPANEYIYLSNVKSNSTIQIFNSFGQKVKFSSNFTEQINIKDLPKGFYFLKITVIGNFTQTAKFIKE